jgi:rhamnosyltransferase
MRRLAIHAHHDAENRVRPFTLFFLEQLRRVCDEIVFVSSAPLPETELLKVRPWCARVQLRENAGRDFGSYQHALAGLDLTACDEVVLTNSSVFGPLAPLAPIFARMAATACDFWGMTDNVGIAYHVQGWFLAFKPQVFRAPVWRTFWDAVLPYRDKFQVIRSYEVGLTQLLLQHGFRPGVVGPVDEIPLFTLRKAIRWYERINPPGFYPLSLLDMGMPFVKTELLRDNPGMVPLGGVYRAMARAGYDLDLIEFDRPRRWPALVMSASWELPHVLRRALRPR